jgi:hypothetical protein
MEIKVADGATIATPKTAKRKLKKPPAVAPKRATKKAPIAKTANRRGRPPLNPIAAPKRATKKAPTAKHAKRGRPVKARA